MVFLLQLFKNGLFSLKMEPTAVALMPGLAVVVVVGAVDAANFEYDDEEEEAVREVEPPDEVAELNDCSEGELDAEDKLFSTSTVSRLALKLVLVLLRPVAVRPFLQLFINILFLLRNETDTWLLLVTVGVGLEKTCLTVEYTLLVDWVTGARPLF
jgi:hypothetical protein